MQDDQPATQPVTDPPSEKVRADRARPSEVGARFDAMSLTPKEVRSVIDFLCGYAPSGVEAALNRIARNRGEQA